MPKTYSFQRYLAAKKAVDDRALSQHVWRSLLATAPERRPLRVLEVGAGIGTMLERLVAWGFPSDDLRYTGVDAQQENITAAREHFAGRRWGTRRIRAEWIAADVFDFLAGSEHAAYDVLIAHAFLDLMDLPATLPRLFSALVPGGLAYFTITFDGVTTFEPTIDPSFDALVERLYHQSMEATGDSQAGRHLYHWMRDAGAAVLAAGPSDWVVIPDGSGGYPGDEAYFLHHILHFFERTLSGHPGLDQARFDEWLHTRRGQIEKGELVYIAHQLDYLGRFAGV